MTVRFLDGLPPETPSPPSRIGFIEGPKPVFSPGQSAAPTAAQPRSYAASEVPGQALVNFPSSLLEQGKNVFDAISHPMRTANTMVDMGVGTLLNIAPDRIRKAVEKTGDSSINQFFHLTPQAMNVASAAYKGLVNNYGSWENIKRTAAEDPAGFLSDASLVFGGAGGTLNRAGQLTKNVAPASRLGEIVAKVGDTSSDVGRRIDPLRQGANAVGKVGSWLGTGISEAVGVLSGQGGKVIREAAESGAEGGSRGKAFRDQMRLGEEASTVVADAKSALQNMRVDRGNQYVANKAQWGNDLTVLNFKNIEKALADSTDKVLFKGVVKNDKAAEVFAEINKTIREWKALNPGEYHTPSGMDALKQKIGGIVDAIPPSERAAQAVGSQIYRAVWNEINAQAPNYAKAMKSYEDASKQIAEIEKTLSLGGGATIDTALRKLQTVMRNNVNANWGQREGLVKDLANAGAPDIMAKLAGQSSSSLSPRGLSRYLGPGMAVGLGSINPSLIPLAALSSPRVVGEIAHLGGRAVNVGQKLSAPFSGLPLSLAARLGAAVERYQPKEDRP